MKVTLVSISVEGDPVDVAGYEPLTRAIEGGRGLRTEGNREATLDGRRRLVSLADFIRDRGATNPHLELVERFLEAVEGFGDGNVDVYPGRSKQSPDGFGDYLMARAPHSRYGAFVYIRPSNGRVTLRLRKDEIYGYGPEVEIVSEDRDTDYQGAIYLRSEDNLRLAIQLAENGWQKTL